MGEVYKATEEEIKGYQSLVGALLWIASITRPDIALAVGKCSRYASNPTPTHDLALKRIVRYLAGSAHLMAHQSCALLPVDLSSPLHNNNQFHTHQCSNRTL